MTEREELARFCDDNGALNATLAGDPMCSPSSALRDRFHEKTAKYRPVRQHHQGIVITMYFHCPQPERKVLVVREMEAGSANRNGTAGNGWE